MNETELLRTTYEFIMHPHGTMIRRQSFPRFDAWLTGDPNNAVDNFTWYDDPMSATLHSDPASMLARVMRETGDAVVDYMQHPNEYNQ